MLSRDRQLLIERQAIKIAIREVSCCAPIELANCCRVLALFYATCSRKDQNKLAELRKCLLCQSSSVYSEPNNLIYPTVTSKTY